MAVKNYDPNICNGVHTVRITVQQWGYTGHFLQKIHGNCRGRDVLGFDFECDDAALENDCEFRFDEAADYFTATLRDEGGNTLLVDGCADDFNKMIVAVEVMEFIGVG